MNRYCLACKIQLIGRSDKKFCNDACRSFYNNQLNASALNYIRQINGVLKKNRSIMISLNPNGKTKVSKDDLIKLGFDFKYFTHTLKTSKGSSYLFCYEYGYLLINHEEILLVKNESLLNP